MKVMKFGGSVLHHEAGFQAMVDIVKRQNEKHVIVISAFSDITRKLNSMMNSALHQSYDVSMNELNLIIQYHEMLSDVMLSKKSNSKTSASFVFGEFLFGLIAPTLAFM